MVTGPANAISLTTMGLIAPLAAAGSADYVRLVLTLTFLVGITQVLLGLARLGSLVDRLPHSVIIGFTAGAALLIANSQIGPLVGLSLPAGAGIASNLTAAIKSSGDMQAAPVLAGLATIAGAIMARPTNRWVPATLVAVVTGTLVGLAVSRTATNWASLKTVSEVPMGLSPFSWPDLTPQTLYTLAIPTIVMTLLALAEASAIARALAERRGDQLDGNQEFIGQGLANITGAFLSASPASGSFNRSGINVASGACTPLAAIFAALFLSLMLTYVTTLIKHLPLAVIAGLLMVVAWQLINWNEIRRILREEPRERIPMVVTFIGTVTLSLEVAILLGLASSLLLSRYFRTPTGNA